MTPEQWLAFVIVPITLAAGISLINWLMLRQDRRAVERGKGHAPRNRAAE